MNKEEFLQWEKKTSDTIDLKRTYIDLTGDLVTGTLLSQIVYWNLPGKGGKTKLRKNKNGKYYLAKRRKDWFEECRISEEQYKRSSKILKKLGIIETEVHRFNNFPTTHIWFNWDRFLELIDKEINAVSVKTTKTEKDHLPKTKEVETPETLTKTIIDYPIQNTINPPLPPPIQGGKALLTEDHINFFKNINGIKIHIQEHTDFEGKTIKELEIEKVRQQAEMRKRYPEVAHMN